VTAMSYSHTHAGGLVLGAWGAVQATAAGLGMAAGAALRDGVDVLARNGWLGEVLQSPVTGYSFVYHLEMYLLFVVLVALGPMLRRPFEMSQTAGKGLGLAEFPS